MVTETKDLAAGGAETQSFAEGKALSADLRATTGEQMHKMVQELERFKKTAQDYILPAKDITITLSDAEPEAVEAFAEFAMTIAGNVPTRLRFSLGKFAHEDFAYKLGITPIYYRRLRTEAPDLMAHNLNYWLQRDTRGFLLRTINDYLRCVLSDRFRVLDSYDLFFHTAKVAEKMGAIIQRLDLSEERFYMRLMMPDFGTKITGRSEDLKEKGQFFSTGYRGDNGRWGGPDDDDPDGDWVFPAVLASNSEVGRGGLTVESAAFRTTCVNYIIVGKSLHRIHLGSQMDSGLRIASDTQDAKDKALWLEARDTVQATFNEEKFKAMVKLMNDAQATELVEPVKAVDTVVVKYDMSDEDKQAILNELLTPTTGVKSGATAWGLLNAVTMVAHSKSVEEGVRLERAGAELLEKIPQLVEVRRITATDPTATTSRSSKKAVSGAGRSRKAGTKKTAGQKGGE